MLIVGGLLLAIVSGVAVLFLTQKASDRIDVVAVASDVAWGEQISMADLQRVQIVADPGLRPVAWADASSVVGKVAAVDLRAGSLLTADSVTTSTAPGEGQALVGLAVKIGQMPSTTSLQPGDRVQLVTLPAQASTEQVPGPVSATVYRVGSVLSGGAYPVDVLVAQAEAARIGTVAAQNRIVIVLLPRAGG